MADPHSPDPVVAARERMDAKLSTDIRRGRDENAALIEAGKGFARMGKELKSRSDYLAGKAMRRAGRKAERRLER